MSYRYDCSVFPVTKWGPCETTRDHWKENYGTGEYSSDKDIRIPKDIRTSQFFPVLIRPVLPFPFYKKRADALAYGFAFYPSGLLKF